MPDSMMYDFAAVGLGPFNLSLACLAEPLAGLNGLFLERSGEFNWHPGILIEGSTLQNPFMADLVSLADPRSRYSYLNYCKEEGKLYAFYIRENYYLDRQEYNRYCRWVVARLSSLRFGHDVRALRYDAGAACYVIDGVQGARGTPFQVRARKLVLGTGTEPAFPACCRDQAGLLHSSAYLVHKAVLQQQRSITVVGSGQSAAEVYYDLLKESHRFDYRLTWITRSPGFFQMENTKLTLEMISPDYIDYFYQLPAARREAVLARQDSLYQGVNASLLNQIYDLLDDQRKSGRLRSRLVSNCELRACRRDAATDRYALEFYQGDEARTYAFHSDGVVFGTGYAPVLPAFIDGIRDRLRLDERGRYQLSPAYAADHGGTEVFVQNGGLHTHGLGNVDLGLSCHRNATILRAITGVDHYALERRIALQDFAVPADAGFVPLAAGERA